MDDPIPEQVSGIEVVVIGELQGQFPLHSAPHFLAHLTSSPHDLRHFGPSHFLPIDVHDSAWVGAGVGLDVGVPVGAVVGVIVGPWVGVEVGVKVRIQVGTVVGFIVGPWVSVEVGVKVGIQVGAGVSLGVGVPVGALSSHIVHVNLHVSFASPPNKRRRENLAK